MSCKIGRSFLRQRFRLSKSIMKTTAAERYPLAGWMYKIIDITTMKLRSVKEDQQDGFSIDMLSYQ